MLNKISLSNVFSLLFMCLPLAFSAQTTFSISGNVSEKSSKLALPGVTVQVTCDGEFIKAVATDIDGGFKIEVGGHEMCSLEFSFVGYSSELFSISEITLPLNVRLKEESHAIGLAVVSASISERAVEEEVVPIEVLKPYLAENTNSVGLKGLVGKTSGVSIMDSQVSIRGGSGYSYGVGSRVSLLLDGLPLLSGDLGEIWWSYLPMEHIGQVEVIKGAASSLYGTGASNGVIHFRTVWPNSKKETIVKAFNGIYSDPQNDAWRWWDDSFSPVLNGASVSHRQAWDKVDLVVGGNVMSDKTYLSTGHEQRARLSAKLRFRPENGLLYGISAIAQFTQMGRFILWDDYETSAYLPMNGTSSEDKWFNMNIDPWLSFSGKNGGSHKLKTRFYRTSRFNPSGSISMASNLYMAEYKYGREINEHISAQVGTFMSLQSSFSSLYPGVSILTFNPAVFGQIEGHHGRLRSVIGARFENNINPGFYEESSGPVLRAGINYEILKGTNFRASAGQSYRFATIAEKYFSTTLTDGIDVIGNIDLQSESGLNLEAGIKQKLALKNKVVYLDAAVFMLEYDDMIEYTLRPQLNSDGSIIIEDGILQFFFQALNIGKSRIAGFEASANGEIDIAGIPVRVFGGATFQYAGDLSRDTSQINMGAYIDNFLNSFGDTRDSLVTAGSLLKYRNSGNFKLDVEADFGPLTIGGSINKQDYVDEIDWYFNELVSGLANFREQFNDGFASIDARLVYNATDDVKLSFIMSNINNDIISSRPGILSAPRSMVFRFSCKF
jgi:outer membrane receptor protein involved in Fe transport